MCPDEAVLELIVIEKYRDGRINNEMEITQLLCFPPFEKHNQAHKFIRFGTLSFDFSQQFSQKTVNDPIVIKRGQQGNFAIYKY